jgi:hypothetical protein
MTVRLNDKLVDFFSEIEINYEWNKIFNINIMDYFPLLKKGLTQIDTYYNVIVIYGLIHSFIDLKNILRDRITDDLLYKILNKYFDYEDEDEDPFLLTAKELDNYEINKIKDDLNKELILSKSLYHNIKTFISKSLVLTKYFNYDNKLFSLLYNPPPEINYFTLYKSKNSPFLSNFINKSTPIRLLSNVLNNNTEDMTIAFYIDEVDFYIGYLDLYKLAISRDCLKIADILKEMIIIKNLVIRQVLVTNFENLIGQSDIPNIIYDIIIK